MVTIIIGAQWGDEGKGKIVDLFSKTADVVCRFNGGNNAGHTIVNEYGTFPLHLVPAGIFRKNTISLITGGVVIDPQVLLSEIELLKKAGITVASKLFISPSCHLIMPYHKVLDSLYEQTKGKGKIGTTGRGIGPVYADKASYNGIQIADVLEKDQFIEKLSAQVTLKNKIIWALGGKILSEKEILETYSDFGNKLRPFIKETFTIIQDAIKKKKQIILEGAQGVFLDNNWGTYPFVTASTVVSGGATAGAGIAPKDITKVIAVVKAYTTRVGEGPFPTELFDANAKRLQEQGHEFGTTTGRPRRCGWFDAELIRFAVKLNGVSEIVITKLDVLDTFKKIKLCTGYTFNGKSIVYTDGIMNKLRHVKPVYREVKGWGVSTRGIKVFKALPKEAKAYIELIDKLIGVKVSYISNGPKRDEIIKR